MRCTWLGVRMAGAPGQTTTVKLSIHPRTLVRILIAIRHCQVPKPGQFAAALKREQIFATVMLAATVHGTKHRTTS